MILENLKALNELTWLLSLATKVGICALSMVIGAVITKILKIAIEKSIGANTRLSERKSKTMITVMQSVSKYLVYFFVFCQILTVFGINITSIIAVASIGSVAVGFGAQNLVQDMISGMFILMEDQYGVGDIISIDALTGTVENITIRTTRLRSADGNLHIIPNGQIKIVTNMSKGYNRAVVDIGIAYEENIDHVIKIMQDELENIYKENKISDLLSVPSVLGVVGLSESSVDIRISADSKVGENWRIERELRRLMKLKLDKEGISIPYPQMVVHIAKE